jgi:hypothetical protein
MEYKRLAEIQTKALDINGRSNVTEDEFTDFIAELFVELCNQHKQHKKTNDLLEGLVNNISISEIANEG